MPYRVARRAQLVAALIIAAAGCGTVAAEDSVAVADTGALQVAGPVVSVPNADTGAMQLAGPVVSVPNADTGATQLAGPVVSAPASALTPSAISAARARATVPDAPPITEVRDLSGIAEPKLIDLTVEPDDLWDRMRTGFSMPDLDGPLVTARQNWYLARPQLLKTIFERSKRYLYHIVAELEKRGMPTELALLPMVESAFNPMAYSRAHASGLWQFIPSTGKRYELAQNSWYDARRDVVASTNAALDYLQFLYDMHGDWHLALASYNWGENAVARAIEKNRARGLPTNYLALTMPTETRNYVPKLQALKNIIANPQAYGLELDPIPNQPYFATVQKTPDIDIRLAAKLAEMPVQELIALNPAYNRPVMSAAQNPTMVLPADRVDTFLENLQNHSEPLTSWSVYTLKKGDRLDKLAAQHGISVDKLKRANAIAPRAQVGAGFQLLLPLKGSSAALEPLPAGFAPPPTTSVRTVIRKVVHTVRRGETLASIAHLYKVSIDDLKRWNPMGRLFAGQKLTIVRQASLSTPVRPASRKAIRRVSARSRG